VLVPERVAAAKEQARLERSVGHHEQAARLLQSAIAELEGALETSQPDERKRIAAELADLWGTLGGVYKRQENLAAAARAYDAGFQYESDPRFGVHSTYNTLNRLVVRILMRPQSLASPSPQDDEDVPQKLRELRPILEDSVAGPRHDDYWAVADLALVDGLLDDDSGAEAAARHFLSLAPPAHALAAFQDTLARLANADPEYKSALDNLKRRLTIS
jgi:tetratricopeptide (TPR) repeat protein